MKVIGLGEVVWDMLPSGKQLGGAPVNFLYFAKALGASAYPISAVGNDELGQETMRSLEKTGLDLSFIQHNDLPTSRVLIELDGNGVPQYDIVQNVAWDAIECTPEALKLVSDADVVCWGSLAQRSEKSRKALLSLIDATPEGCRKIFDINIRQHYYSRELIEESLRRADILKLNEDELPLLIQLFGLESDFDAAVAALISKYDFDYVILTQGRKCSDIYDASGKVSSLPTPKAKIADTVGAGDSFTAAFVISLLKGEDVKRAHSIAVAIAAWVCAVPGAINPLPDAVVDLKKYSGGLQHVGIPASDIDVTEKFFLSLGFENIHTNHTDDGKVCFLKMGNLVIEAYQCPSPALCYGAIDHIAIDVNDIEALYVNVVRAGFKVIEGGINNLPFWQNGIRYFIIEGPDKVKVEFSQIL